jgi:hypothetical protein
VPSARVLMVVALLWLLALGVLLYGGHRLALWLEERGAIYYRRKPTTSSLGSAFLEVQSLLEPGARKVVEERQRVDLEEEAAGDPPDAGEA